VPSYAGDSSDPEQESAVEGIQLPVSLAYSRNHMWLDHADDGMCHIGVDAFLTRIFQRIDAVNFLPSSSSVLPTVVLTVHGVDLQLVFPIPLNVTRVNSYLRADLQKLISHPYSAGWLYEGTLFETDSSASPALSTSMMRGDEAVRWMENEVRHLSDFIHDQIIPNQSLDQPVMMDGGIVHSDFINHLNRQELLQLFNEFFSLNANWRKTT
jgi:glycine cleavage system H lipoate-binding protein